jgi:sugar phosphate permease
MNEHVSTAERKRPWAPASHVRYGVLAFACALAIVTYIQRLGFSAAAPEIGDSLHLDANRIADLGAVWLVAYGLFQVPGGLLGDRWGPRHVLTSMVLVWSLLTAGVGLAVLLPQVWALPFLFLLAMRFAFGGLQAGGFPVIGRIMADWMPTAKRGFAQGCIWTMSRFGGFVIPLVLPYLFLWFGDSPGRTHLAAQAVASQGLAPSGAGALAWPQALAALSVATLDASVRPSWPIPFVLLGGLGVLWCVAFWPWFRNRPEQMPGVNRGEREVIEAGRASVSDQPAAVPWSRMFSSVSIWSLCLMYGCMGFSGNFFTSGLLPVYLRDDRHLESQPRAWLTGLPLAGGAVACVLGGLASDRLIRRWGSRKWGRRAAGMLGLSLTGLAFLSTIWVHNVWLLGLLLTVSFFGNDLSIGPAWASCADIGERYAGTVSGAMNMIGALFGVAGTKLAGHLLKQNQSEWVFIIFAVVYGLAALCWLGVDVTRRLADAPAAR